MSYYRKVKIYYEFDIKPLKDLKFEGLINFIDDIFKDIQIEKVFFCNIYIGDKYRNKISLLFYHKFKNHIVYINYHKIWAEFEHEYNCKDKEIEKIMLYLLYKKYQLKNISTTWDIL